MVQRFFFNGIKGKGAYVAVKRNKALAVFIAPHTAGAETAAGYYAGVRAKAATYGTVFPPV
jgi:hypothetical protein